MWIKAQDGELYNAEIFGMYKVEVRNDITHVLVGIDKNRNGKTELLKYSSFEDRNFIKVAKTRIENAIKNRWSFCDLSDICKVDYTAEEIEKARRMACPF